jgi:hypothetical protein
MQFEYEIPVDEYISSQVLYHRLRSGRKGTERSVGWVLAGFLFIVIIWNEVLLNWATRTLLGCIGARLCRNFGSIPRVALSPFLSKNWIGWQEVPC